MQSYIFFPYKNKKGEKIIINLFHCHLKNFI
jgi:hypothetical protein